ncbi:hypothetical protein K505DRAFT_287764 [Melanomma pulvis-pyrius CBS 109.77]|uniref:BTB domain-containing protein n=1 Tax=Melanomma pulvis-pyrius CBS 109.77 TaxID=1314802 RepID=A0A6A6WTV9_9PLEO|nr:hypothetical protein K505DRAFT_287764 [Melanomma pulvis-pyrius CBS 109.77]
MATTFADFILSHQFTFFVGQEEKPIVVHAAAIAAASQQLDALINGGMGESETRCARLEDVEVDDFIRFCEYAYRGDYTVPSWEELPPESSFPSGTNQQNISDDGWGTWAPGPKKKKKGTKWRAAFPDPEPPPMDMDHPPHSADMEDEPLVAVPEPAYEVMLPSRTQLRAQFNSRRYLDDGGPKALILQHFEPKPNSAVDQNFTPVLLAHARLYCFAHLRLIAPLKALTLDKLHKTLMAFKLYTKRVGDIIELTRYAYSNPDLPDRSDDGALDDLRKLVVEYIVCEIDTIGNCVEFVKFLEEGGEFVGDFWRLARDYVA